VVLIPVATHKEQKLTKKTFLSRKVNIIISLVQGIPTFAFAVWAILSGFSDTMTGMISISIIGSLFCLILEFHSSLRFQAEWVQISEDESESVKPSPGAFAKIVFILHNLLFWSFVLPFVTPVSWRVGFIIFTIILFIRFVGVSIINIKNMDAKQYYQYPFRLP
jgi:hypothetical protein